jgi:hypothetical protein
MKKFALAFALAAAGLLTGVSASAATPQLTSPFDVNIDLTTGCIITQAPSAVHFTYTAFGSAVNLDTPGSFKVKCSGSLSYDLALDGTGAYVDDATNLAYTLTLSATTGLVGTGTNQNYTITGRMAGNQAGQCAASAGACDNSAATNKTRTLTISY